MLRNFRLHCKNTDDRLYQLVSLVFGLQMVGEAINTAPMPDLWTADGSLLAFLLHHSQQVFLILVHDQPLTKLPTKVSNWLLSRCCRCTSLCCAQSNGRDAELSL